MGRELPMLLYENEFEYKEHSVQSTVVDIEYEDDDGPLYRVEIEYEHEEFDKQRFHDYTENMSEISNMMSDGSHAVRKAIDDRMAPRNALQDECDTVIEEAFGD